MHRAPQEKSGNNMMRAQFIVPLQMIITKNSIIRILNWPNNCLII